jgi:hypothetical protein
MKNLCLLFMLLCASSSWAAENSESKSEKSESKEAAPRKNEIDDILDNMGYPELQVVPRASDRLAIEAKSENSGIFQHWTIELSGLATMAVGFTNGGNLRPDLDQKEQQAANTIGTITAGIGGAWVVGGALLGGQQHYQSGMNQVNKYQGKDERSQLMRERLAEEALERPARLVRTLQYFSVATNLAVNGLSFIYANNAGRINAGVGAALSFLPLLFQDHSIDVYDKQMDYKKKIYTPIKSVSFSYDPYHKSYTPMSSLTWMF